MIRYDQDIDRLYEVVDGFSSDFDPKLWKGHFSPLHAAAEVGWEEATALFVVSYTGLTRCRDEFGRFPYQVAEEFGHHEIAENLKEWSIPGPDDLPHWNP